jgi:uncharacterized protein YjbI with pentapeptide repeats
MVALWAVVGPVLALVVAGLSLVLVPEWSQGDSTSLTKPAGRPVPSRKRVRQRLQQRRPLVLIYLGLVAVAALAFVIWVLPLVLTEHPYIPKSAERHTAITQTRTSLVAMLAAIGAAGGLAFTARTYRLSREGHITDRYSKAVEQLGSDKIEVRLGGIYALERLMRDSPSDRPTIVEVLAAFIRQHAPRSSRLALPARGAPPSVPDHPAEDVQASLTVLGRRHPVYNGLAINLRRINLMGANLSGAGLAGADLREAGLAGADLREAGLAGADLREAGLAGADLREADLAGANLTKAILTDATLYRADLTDATLYSAALTRARLTGATMTGANLSKVDLTGGAYVREADLTGANLGEADLTGAWLIGATLTGANLMEATLADANLGEAILTGANLHRVDLTGANLREATLTRARLAGATLTHGSVSEKQLASAENTDKIRWVGKQPEPSDPGPPPA